MEMAKEESKEPRDSCLRRKGSRIGYPFKGALLKEPVSNSKTPISLRRDPIRVPLSDPKGIYRAEGRSNIA